MAVLPPLLLALLAAPVTALTGLVRPRWAARVGTLTAAFTFAATVWGWSAGGGSVEIAWAPSWNLRLAFALDGLATLYSLLATGIGLAVVVYSAGYLPLHLHHQHRPEKESVRFYAFVLLFMGSMVGLATAQDLLLIFVFWDLTAISSYYLIGYDRQSGESRSAALMALLVTGITAVLFLIGSLMLFVSYGTFSLPELVGRVQSGPVLLVSGGLMLVAGLAKSAQFPFHFWLPRAMAAPTPVSAYLHSAAMVAAGVFLLGRLYPLLARSEQLLELLLAVGSVSMAVGGVLALTRNVLKQLLAYSTVAQYGYVVTMLGLGGTEGAIGATYYVLVHALAKSALFLTAGAVTTATDEDEFSSLGGLARRMPLLAVASGVAAATLAGLPLTAGFFKDELFFAAALHRGALHAGLAVVGAALTFAYSWRFWSAIFLGQTLTVPRAIPLSLPLPVAVLSALALAGGLYPQLFAGLAGAASSVSLAGAPVAVKLAYYLDTRPENIMALATYALGVALSVAWPAWSWLAVSAARFGELAGPERWYRGALKLLNRLSSWLHGKEVRDLRERVATILIPTSLLVVAALAVTPWQDAYRPGELLPEDLALVGAVAISGLAALATVLARTHLVLVLSLSGVGYSLAVVYALIGAPDIALVAVLVETIFSLLLLGAMTLFPDELPPPPRLLGGLPWRDLLLATATGAGALAVSWGALSQPAGLSVGAAFVELAPQAHAGDVVTAILADFRGLDTLGEITVIAIALLGVVALLRRWSN